MVIHAVSSRPVPITDALLEFINAASPERGGKKGRAEEGFLAPRITVSFSKPLAV